MTEYEHLDGEDGYKGISRFTCYKPTYTVDEWENGEIIREWDIMRVKEDYFAFLVYVNKIFKENEQLKQRISEAKSMEFQILNRDIENLKREKEELKYHLDKTNKELQEYKDFMSLG